MPNIKKKYLYVSLFIISASFLIVEFLISRIMSVVAWYHFAFFAISLALFGMAIGAVTVHLNKAKYLERIDDFLASYAFKFGLSLLNLIFVISQLTFFYNITAQGIVYDYMNMAIIFLSICLPFIFAGVFMCLCLTRYAAEAHKAYFINLLGSSLGCLVFIPLVNLLNAFNTMLFVALLSFLTSYLIHRSSRQKSPLLRGASFFSVVAVFVIITINMSFNIFDFQWTKGRPDLNAHYKKWNAFSYIRLTHQGLSTPYGWGLSPVKFPEILNQRIRQSYLEIDGAAGTMMTEFRGDISTINYLKYDITAFPHHLIKDGNIMVIGVGAGRDILAGLAFEQKNILGLEINGSILETLNDIFGDMTGHLDQYPNIQFVNDEARSYIASAKREFDLIQISLIDTMAASLSGAYALTENSLYTREAFEIYIKNLTPQGILSVSHWMNLDFNRYFLRLAGLASSALERLEINDTRKHIAIVYKNRTWEEGGVANLMVKKTPFTPEDIAEIQKICDDMGFQFILNPLDPAQHSLAMMADASTRDQFVQKNELNILPATDDSPFFFLFQKLNLKSFIANLKTFNMDAEKILFSLLVLMITLTAVFVLLPLLIQSVSQSQPIIQSGLLPLSIYFSSIGLAFMFVEVSQMTRLSIFLGHPVYSLTVVLFTLLVSSSLGSYHLGGELNQTRLKKIYGAYILLALFLFMSLPWILRFLTEYNLLTRIVVSMLVIAPLGFFMGSFMPHGIRLAECRKGSIAFFGGLNGAMSVIGSILTMIFMIAFGINATFLIGIAMYSVAIGLLWKLTPADSKI